MRDRRRRPRRRVRRSPPPRRRPDLIGDLRLSVAEVGGVAGFADQFAFNKAFRRWTGKSPSAYRRGVLGREA
ncbi:MAG: helix-turn-helix domain-containing protein [Candidatus Binatia bacterium]